MAKKYRKFLHRRAFLNDKEGLAAIEITAEAGEFEWDGTVSMDFEGRINLTDCYRTVSLEFFANTPKTKTAALAKLDRLLAHIQLVRDALAATDVPPHRKIEKEAK